MTTEAAVQGETVNIDSTDRDFPEDYLDQVFGEAGYLAGRFDGYSPREGQVALATAVDAAFRGEGGRRHLLAEGPTGTGKSLAYLVPATYWAARNDQVVVVATANIALQEQLVQKDLPVLQEILPWDFDFALLKGLNNFLCEEKLTDRQVHGELFADRRVAKAMGIPDQLDYRDPKVREQAIETWATTTKTGDVNELPFTPGSEWGKFSVAADECRGKSCPQFKNCFGQRAKKQARQAQVIVTNFALLFAHLAIKMQTGGVAGALPQYDHLILDEAHKAADTARDFFGFSVGSYVMKRAADRLRDTQGDGNGIDSKDADRIEQAGGKLFDSLGYLYRSPEYKTRLKAEGQLQPLEDIPEEDRDPDYPDETRRLVPGEGYLGPLLESIDAARGQARSIRGRLAQQFDPDVPSWELSKADQRIAKRYDEIGRAMRKLGDAAHSLWEANELKQKNQVYFLDEGRNGQVRLSSRKINVASLLRDELFDSTAGSVILTSATLATGGDFNFLKKEVGSPPKETAEIIVKSPFNWESQALLVVPHGLPAPNDKSFTTAIGDIAIELIKQCEGRCLLLFTSYAKLRAVNDRLHYAGLPYQILVQGERPRTQLVNEFKNDTSSVLLGTESFWAGVDVPGEACSAVMIDRIPFPTPDNPVLDAITEVNPNRWFFDYSVPKASIQLSQGVGRLIRSISDRGVVVLLDNRIVEKSYGGYFLKGLPYMDKTRNLSSVREFLFPDEVDPFD